jgi:multisubunit Na+/H+ antiporter MnhB subunit
LPAIELVLLVVVSIADPGRVDRESSVLRALGLGLVAVASLALALSTYLRRHDLADERDRVRAGPLAG